MELEETRPVVGGRRGEELSSTTKSTRGSTKSTRRIGLEVAPTPAPVEGTTIKPTRGTRSNVSTLRVESEGVRRPSVLAPHFPTSTGNQMPMMFYNPYMQYPMMPGQNFPVQGFLPPQMMMPGGELPSMSSMEGGSSGNNPSARRQPTGQDRSKTSKSSAEGRNGGDDESAEHMNLAVHAAQEQQRMMNQWAAASNFPGGSLMTGDDYLRAEDYNPNVPQNPVLSGPLGSFYAGGNAMPSPGFLGSNLTWPTNAPQQRGSQETN